MRRLSVILCIVSITGLCAFAQDALLAGAPEPPPVPAPPPAASAAPDQVVQPAAQPEAPPAPPKEEKKGDVITLKSGTVLKNVQVVGRSPMEYEVEVIPGVTLNLPRREVVSIEYDNIEPTKTKGPKGDVPGEETMNLIGKKIKPEVVDKFTAPIPDPPLKYDNQDMVNIFAEISQRLGLTIVVDDVVKALPANERLWGFETKPGMTLMNLLQQEFPTKFPNLAVVYQYDNILITTKEKAAALVTQETGQTPPPPARAESTPQPVNPPAAP